MHWTTGLVQQACCYSIAGGPPDAWHLGPQSWWAGERSSALPQRMPEHSLSFQLTGQGQGQGQRAPGLRLALSSFACWKRPRWGVLSTGWTPGLWRTGICRTGGSPPIPPGREALPDRCRFRRGLLQAGNSHLAHTHGPFDCSLGKERRRIVMGRRRSLEGQNPDNGQIKET